MEERIKQIEQESLSDIEASKTQEELEAVNIKYLGRKGIVSELFKDLKSVPDTKKPVLGHSINKLKQAIEFHIKQHQQDLLSQGVKQAGRGIDVTMPGESADTGSIHPITKTVEDICAVFSHMGFAVVEGPEIETEHNNFDALNIPADHPSRDGFDTFYIKDQWLLRSHTSPVQIRYMQSHKPPFAILVPGKVFRPDAVDASHSFMFHQIEGLMVADKISFANLKWTIYEFARQYFGQRSKVRFRPHFFPFTEPSAEVDISCMICSGDGCRVCSQKGWLEIMGAGSVHPNVFKAVGIDPDKYCGFAFGMGVDRIAMLKYGIDDIRLLYENDLRFLRQF